MLDGPLLVPGVLLAATLALSGIAKVRAPESARDAFTSLRLPGSLARSPLPAVLPWAEIALALAILVLPGVWGVAAAAAGLVLMLAYLAVIVRALGFDEPVTCSCFGRLGLGAVTTRTAVRNAVLSLVAALAVWGATADRSIVSRLLDAPATTWAWLVMAALSGAVAVLVAGGEPRADASSTAVDDDVELDYVRQPIPYGILVDADGTQHALHELSATSAQLLVFVSLGCGPCMRVLPLVPEWAEELAPVEVRVVVGQDLATVGGEHEHLRPRLLHDPEIRVMRLFSVGTPSAVLLGADGLLAGGPVTGELEIVDFVEDIRAEIHGGAPVEEPAAG